jgi:hypothetical protein
MLQKLSANLYFNRAATDRVGACALLLRLRYRQAVSFGEKPVLATPSETPRNSCC